MQKQILKNHNKNSTAKKTKAKKRAKQCGLLL
jgi:hypothetical protein